MAEIKPFRALRPHNEYAAQVASPPYDVMNREEATAEVNGNRLSFLHVTRAEVDLPADVDVHEDAVYQKAKGNLEKLISDHILFQDEKPCYYIYELGWKGRTQTGLVCVSSVDDYFEDAIKKHEYTRPEKEKDRIDHMLAIRAQTGNVFLACKDNKDLSNVLESWKAHQLATYTFTTADGVSHTVWVVDSEATVSTITSIFADHIPATYIADGHHRAASAAKVSKELPDSDEAKYFLTTIFQANQLAILDYNRVITDLNGHNEGDFLKALEADYDVEKLSAAYAPDTLHTLGMYLGGQWYKLTAKEHTYTDDPIGVLDISVLQKTVLEKLLDIKDQRTDKRIDFVGGIRGLDELKRRVDSGEMSLAFSLFPVSIQQLFDIADSGSVMPPKSTWFEPKLRDGLLTHRI